MESYEFYCKPQEGARSCFRYVKPSRSVCNAALAVEMISACLQIFSLDKTLQWQECNIIFTFEKAITRTGFMLADNVKVLSSIWRAICSKITFRHITTYYDTCICRKDMKEVEIGRNK